MEKFCISQYDERKKLLHSKRKIDFTSENKKGKTEDRPAKRQKFWNPGKVLDYEEIKFKTPLSNYFLKTFRKPNVDRIIDNTGSTYRDMHIQLPSQFKDLTKTISILHAHTSSLSDVYSGKGTQNSATCVMAILLKKFRPVKSWVRTTLDEILNHGDIICQKLKERKSLVKHITSADFADFKCKVEDSAVVIKVEIMSISGTIASRVPSILNLKDGLVQFFLVNNGGILETSSLVVGIWKEDQVYYMFQPYNCDYNGLRVSAKIPEEKSSKKKEHYKPSEGKSCLLRFSDLNDLTNLFINNLGRKNKNDHYVIRFVKSIDDIPGSQDWYYFMSGEEGKSWILSGTISNNFEDFNETSRGKQGIALPVISLITAHEVSPDKWNSQTVNEIVTEGDEYFNWCTSNQEEDKNLNVNTLKKKVYLKNKMVKIEVEESTIDGYLKELNYTLNLEEGLQKFFTDYECTYGILETDSYSFGVWKSQEDTEDVFSFYLFYPNQDHNVEKNEPEGKSVAYVQRFLKLPDVAEYIKKLYSTAAPESAKNVQYFIHNLNVLSVGKPLTEEEIEQDKLKIEADFQNYSVISEEVAILQGSFSQNNEMIFGDKTRDKQQSGISFVALVMSKLHDSCSWRSETVDDILRMGDKLTAENVCNLQEPEDERNFLLPDEINKEFNLGIFKISVSLEEQADSGKVDSLEKRLGSFFELYSMGILRQDDVSISIWKVQNFYFILDSRGRDKNGSTNEKSGKASVIWTTNVSKLFPHLKSGLRKADGEYKIDGFSIENIVQSDSEAAEESAVQDEHDWYSFKKIAEDLWSVTSSVKSLELYNQNQTVTISIIGILFAKIYPPQKFTSKILDEIIEIGSKFYKNCKGTQENKLITLNNVFKNLYFTNCQFKFNFYDCLQYGVMRGKKKSTLNLEEGLEMYFYVYNSGILIIDRVFHITLFKSDDFFYCIIPDYEIIKTKSTKLLAQQILLRYETSQDFEISMIDIFTHPEVSKLDCVFNYTIDEANLPPLNAFQQFFEPFQAVLTGSINQNSKIVSPEIRGKTNAAVCIIALAVCVIKCPSNWTKKVLDEILLQGIELHKDSTNVAANKEKIKITDINRIIEIGEIILTIDVEKTASILGLIKIPAPDLEIPEEYKTKKRQKSKKEDKKKIEAKKKIEEKTKTADKQKSKKKNAQMEKSEIDIEQIPAKELGEGVIKFFSENNAGILVSKNCMLAIWKDFDVFYMFISYVQNEKKTIAKCCVKWFTCLQVLIEDIENFIKQEENSNKYKIHRVVVNTVVTKVFPHPPGFEYYALSDSSGSLKSIKKLPTPDTDISTYYKYFTKDINVLLQSEHEINRRLNLKSRIVQSSAVALIVIAVTELHRPYTWTPIIISETILYGEKLFQESTCILRIKNRSLLPSELCQNFIIANFQVSCSVKRSDISGVLQNYDLIHSLNFFFKKHERGILYTGNTGYAVMHCEDNYYLFQSAFPGSIINDNSEYVACMLQSSNLTKLVSIFIDSLNTPKSSVFDLYEVKMGGVYFFEKKFKPSLELL